MTAEERPGRAARGSAAAAGCPLLGPPLRFPSHRGNPAWAAGPGPASSHLLESPSSDPPQGPQPAGGARAVPPKKHGTRKRRLMRDFCLLKSVYVLVRGVSGMSRRCCCMYCTSIGLEGTVRNPAPRIALGQGVRTVRLMHACTGLSSRERTARCQQTPCWRELVTSSGEKGLLAAVGQECGSMDTSESCGFIPNLEIAKTDWC